MINLSSSSTLASLFFVRRTKYLQSFLYWIYENRKISIENENEVDRFIIPLYYKIYHRLFFSEMLISFKIRSEENHEYKSFTQPPEEYHNNHFTSNPDISSYTGEQIFYFTFYSMDDYETSLSELAAFIDDEYVSQQELKMDSKL